MNRLTKLALLAAVSTALLTVLPSATAQQGQRPDPEQMRQRMMDNYRERLGIKSDDEWKVIQPRIEKVTEARRAVGGGGGGMMRPRRNADAAAPADAQQNQRRGGFNREPSAEETALQKAIEGKASKEEIKAKLTALRDARKVKEADLEKAQDELRKVLTLEQEAEMVLSGLLK